MVVLFNDAKVMKLFLVPCLGHGDVHLPSVSSPPALILFLARLLVQIRWMRRICPAAERMHQEPTTADKRHHRSDLRLKRRSMFPS
ncbi:hypothetical protein LIA77_11461 [Sarocladium implicatum]|nr:hypothetical protein LIA77_11461 [Sarocladium implicatum]